MSLYEDLGVAVDATKKQIRDAYRKLAKKTHPDTGGDKDQFLAVQTAYLVLTDDARRKQYDEDGTTDKGDDMAQEAMTHVVSAFAEALSGVEDIEHINLADKAKSILFQRRASASATKTNQQRALGRGEKVLKRLRRSAGDRDFVRESLVQMTRQMETDIAASERQYAILTTAIEYAKAYSYQVDERPRDPFGGTFATGGLINPHSFNR